MMPVIGYRQPPSKIRAFIDFLVMCCLGAQLGQSPSGLEV
jgi:hypothetical protein